MKRRFLKLSILFLFIIMLLFPKPVFNGASKGLLLWFNVILPTLLPFIIISNLLIRTQAAAMIARVTGPIFCRIFHVSGYGSFAVLTGFLCGYPMGSKVTADLLNEGHISKEEGRYLLSFCNNTSPMFIVSYVIWQNMKDESLTVPALVILTLAPVICSFFFRRYYNVRSIAFENHQNHLGSATGSSSGIVDTCIMNGFETITKVGGYIMLFSIVIALAELLPVHQPLLSLVALSSLEITNGIAIICSMCTNSGFSFVLALALTSFGGWCSIAQTKCMIQGTGLPILPYIIEKLITAGVTSLLACAYIFLLK